MRVACSQTSPSHTAATALCTALFPSPTSIRHITFTHITYSFNSADENWSYKSCKAPVKLSPPTNQHPTFYRPDALPVAKPYTSLETVKFLPFIFAVLLLLIYL